MDEPKNENGKVGGVYTYFQSLFDLIPHGAKKFVCGCVDDIILHSIASIFIKPFMSYVFLTTLVLVLIAGIAPHPLIFAFFSILTYADQHFVDMVITGLVKSASAIWVDAAMLWFIMSVNFFRGRRRRLPRREWIARWDVITLGINAVVYLGPWAPQQDFVYVSASTTPPEDDGFRMTWGLYASLLLVLCQVEAAFAGNIWQTRRDAQTTPKGGKYECLRRVWYGFRFWGWTVLNRAMIYLCNMAAWDAVVELVVWEYVPVAYGGLANFGMLVGLLTFVVLWVLERWKAMWGVRVGSKRRGRDKGGDGEDDDEDDESDDDESDSDGDEREEDHDEEDVDVEDREVHGYSREDHSLGCKHFLKLLRW